MDETRLIAARYSTSVSSPGAWRKNRSPCRVESRKDSCGLAVCRFGMRMKHSSVVNATANVAKSANMTARRPPSAISAIASAGVSSPDKLDERYRSPPTRWYCDFGSSAVVAASLAGCWSVFIKPFSALRRYKCVICSRSVCSRTSATTVVHAASASLTSIVRRVSRRSTSAPQNRLNTTYGA